MKRIVNIFPFFLVLLMLVPRVSFGNTIAYQAHLWLGDQLTDFSDYENSPGYVGENDDAWLNESIVDADPFDLYIYNATSRTPAVDVHIIATIHSGETGTFSFFGSTYDQTDFIGAGLPTGHNGSHGVWSPSGDGIWLDIATDVDIASLTSHNFGQVSFSGFSEVHFDAWSLTNNARFGLRNPYSHDKTAVPEPSTLLLLGSGLIGLALVGRTRINK